MAKKYFRIDNGAITSRDLSYIIAPVWESVSIHHSKDQYENDLKPYCFHHRSLFAVLWYMKEINNGGHFQFYTNSTGIVWDDAMNGFELMGILEARDIIKESARRFKEEVSYDKTERENRLRQLGENFNDLDDRYYALDKKINIYERVADFVVHEDNKIAFFFEGEVEVY